VLIGSASVGKTSLLGQFVDHRFDERQASTIGANYQIYSTEFQDLKVDVQIWDTAGQEMYRSLGPIYYRDALAAIAVFDVTNRQSFDDLGEWIDSFKCAAGSKTVVVVVGNKIDQVGQRAVRQEEAEAMAKEHGFLCFHTSAKTGEGVHEVIHTVAQQIVNGIVVETPPPLEAPRGGRNNMCMCRGK
jgi:small GTP-binding protein